MGIRILFLLVLMMTGLLLSAQDTPLGMHYQAIARDGDGQVIANTEMLTKVEMIIFEDGEQIVYEENHLSNSNQFGLLNLTIGEGDVSSGEFSEIDWSKQNIWVRISVRKSSDNEFRIVTSNRLYSVPYAYYAGEAGQLSKEKFILKSSEDKPPKPSKGGHWDVEGNIKAEKRSNEPPLLGNADYAPIVFITDDKERMRITEDGDIIMAQALSLQGNTTMDEDLIVKQNVYLNTEGGETEINGPTTIGGPDMNPTVFTGDVQMDKTLNVDGATTLNDILDVDGETTLNNTLDVDGATTLNNTLDVDGATTLNDILDVDGETTLNNTLDVDGATTLNDILDVDGKTTLNNVCVSATLDVEGISTFNNKVNITDATSSTGTTTGALTVSGGVGIGENLNVLGVSMLNDKLFVVKDVSDVQKSYLTGQVVPDNGYVAVFNNTNDGFGDGIKIKLGRDRTPFAPDLDDLPPDIQAGILGATSAASEQIKNLIKCEFTGNKLSLLQDIVVDGGLEDAKLAAGVAIGLTNTLIDILNAQLELPWDLSVPVNESINFTEEAVNFTLDGAEFVLNSIVETGIEVPVNTSISFIESPINTALDGIQFPINSTINFFKGWDLASPINDAFLPITVGPINVGPLNTPSLGTPATVIDVPVIPTFTLPGISIPSAQIIPLTEIFPLTTLVPEIDPIRPFASLSTLSLPRLNVPRLDVPYINIPSVSIPRINPIFLGPIPHIQASDINAIINAAIPGNSFPDIVEINVNSLDFWNIPNICMDEGTNVSSILNSQNEFITFTDKDDNKMGSIKAWSMTDWSNKFLNPLFLKGMRDAITQSKVDKLHGKYHFGLERTKALLAYANIGVEYRSGNGDYAEWLERVDTREIIGPGDIVGVIGGRITKDLADAEQVMAVSHFPIVLGNIPDEEKIHKGNNVAFMGQIPVKILGPVSTGDYIVGNLETPGYGIAINPEHMNIEDFKYAVGRSWETDQSKGIKMINTVVGVHNGDYLKILSKYERRFKESESRMESLESKVDALSKKMSSYP